MDNFSDYNSSMGQHGFGDQPKSGSKKVIDFVWEMAKVALISLVIIIPIRYFLIQPFYVKGASMEPNFYDHEYLIIDEISYRFSQPQRGDIVVFRYPKDPKQFFIKRVIGLPGETVKIEDGFVYIIKDGQTNMLNEDYLPGDIQNLVPVGGYRETKLASDEYFVLGDNRDQSLDSRIFGAVKEDYIVGRTWLRGWPFTRLTIFNTPNYEF